MGFIFGLVKKLIKYALVLLVFATVIILIPNLPPYTKFTRIEIEPTLPLEGPLALNGDLNNVEKLYKDKLLGPEAFQMYSGEIYASLATGEIVKISPGGHVTFVTKIGQHCSGLTQAHKCGRPLGFQIDEKTKHMYVADAYLGIWKINMATDKKQLLVSPRVEIEGRAPKIFNSLALAQNGDFYWTDSSSDFLLNDGVYTSLADPSGRLFYYNAKKNQSKVLLDDLWFPNGVVMSPDNQFVLVSETLRLRVLKYYIDGPKKGKSEVFVGGLPGLPDNVRALPDGSGALVALYAAGAPARPLLQRALAGAPLARKLLARLQRLLEIPFEVANQYYPNAVLEDIVYHIGHFQSMSSLLPGMSGLLQIDWNGNIVASHYNTEGTLHISDAIVYNDKLFIGSPNVQNYIAAVPAPPLLKKAFASVKAIPPPKTAETVTKEIPKPKVEPKPQQAKRREETKPNVQEKPKVEVKQEKKIEKPAAQEAPKTTPPPKTVEKKAAPTPKSTTPTPKRDTKSTTSTPKQETKPTTPAPKQETKATTPKPEAKPASKPEPVKSPPPKQSPPPQTTTQKPAPKSEQKDAKKTVDKKLPEQIPITEDILVDTAKPSKDKLKVIKKDGPTEIPHPNM